MNIPYIDIAFLALLIAAVLRFVIKNYLMPVKKVKAKVIEKNTYRRKRYISSYSSGLPEREYVVTFLIGERKVSFNVSELGYGGYRMNETGTLIYKGSRIIDFK